MMRLLVQATVALTQLAALAAFLLAFALLGGLGPHALRTSRASPCSLSGSALAPGGLALLLGPG